MTSKNNNSAEILDRLNSFQYKPVSMVTSLSGKKNGVGTDETTGKNNGLDVTMDPDEVVDLTSNESPVVSEST